MSIHSEMVNHVHEIEIANQAYEILDSLFAIASANRTIRPCQIAAVVQVKESISNLIEILAPQCPFSQIPAAMCCENITKPLMLTAGSETDESN